MELTRFPAPSIFTSSPFIVTAFELLRKRSQVIWDLRSPKRFLARKTGNPVIIDEMALRPQLIQDSYLPDRHGSPDPNLHLRGNMSPDLLHGLLFGLDAGSPQNRGP